MVKWFKKKRPAVLETLEPNIVIPESITSAPVGQVHSHHSNFKENFINRMKVSLSKTRHQLYEGLSRLFLGKKTIDSVLLDELETLLLLSDLGAGTVAIIIKQLHANLARKQLLEPHVVMSALKANLIDILSQAQHSPLLEDHHKPLVILVIGINGAGKTTTIGKLAKLMQQEGKKVMLAAGDTFRAAALEQLKVWGERNNIPVVAHQIGADSAAVIFDALQAAKARKIDVLIADTAGRLHTQNNLMAELKKIKRVLQKLDNTAPHETLLVLDANIGQNALVQARQFHQEIGLTGAIMTKLDGTAKGGILVAIAKELKIPFLYLGIGEKIDDLCPFNATEFVEAILGEYY